MEAVEVETRIRASASTVWSVLVDVQSWADWDSGVTGVDGAIQPGSVVIIHAPSSPWRAFAMRVVVYGEDEVIVLSGGLWFGLFTSLRTYSIAEYYDETIFHIRQSYSGPLAFFFAAGLPDPRWWLTQFSQGLKHRAELVGR